MALRGAIAASALLAIVAGYAQWLAPEHAWGFRVAPEGTSLTQGLAAVVIGALVVIAGRSRVVSARTPWVWGAALVVGAAAVFTRWRAATPLDGDGLAMLSDVLTGAPMPRTEPLAQWVQRLAYLIHLQLVPPDDHGLLRIVMGSAAAVAIASGVVAVACVFATPPAGEAAHAPALGGRLALVALVFSQGAVALFFGHLEHYALVSASWIAFVVCALGVRAPGPRLVIAGLLLALAIAVHVMSIVLLPAWFVWLWWHARSAADRGARAWAAAAAFVPVVLGMGTIALLGSRVAASGAPWGAVLRGLLVAPRDPWGTINSVHMNGAAAFLIALLGAAWVAARWASATPAQRFAGVLAGSAWVPLFVLPDSNLGFARNWNLYAPLALLAAWSGGVLLREALSRRGFAAVAGLVAGLSLLHTIPMVATLADPDASETRFARLPLAAGDARSTLGLWFAVQGDEARVEAEWRRGVAAAPGNVRLRLQLGHLELRQGRALAARDQYRMAQRLAPGLMAPVAGEIVAESASGRADEARQLAAGHEAALLALLPAREREPVGRWIRDTTGGALPPDVNRSLRTIALGRH